MMLRVTKVRPELADERPACLRSLPGPAFIYRCRTNVDLPICTSRKWLGGVCAVIVILIGLLAAQRVTDVAAVQNAVDRDMEVGFGEPGATWDKPPMLPAWIDAL